MDSKTELSVKKILIPKFYKITWTILLIIFIGDFIYVMRTPQPLSEQSILLFVGVLSLTVFVGFISFIIWIFTKASKRLRKFLILIPVLFIVLILVLRFVISTITVAGNSMPTYKDGSTQVICKICKSINRNEVVVYHSDNDHIARVIGLPRETVIIHKGTVLVNREALKEPYADWSNWKDTKSIEIKLGENEYFTLFDHRNFDGDNSELINTHKFNSNNYIGKIL